MCFLALVSAQTVPKAECKQSSAVWIGLDIGKPILKLELDRRSGYSHSQKVFAIDQARNALSSD